MTALQCWDWQTICPTFVHAPAAASVASRFSDGIDPNAVGLEIMEVLASPSVTHLRYALKKKR